jgi:uncharacterized protein YozE (UPF0346 family)
MITMKEWMELVDYKITEGGEYGWQCYGPNAYCLDSWNDVHGKGGYSFNIIFSTKSQKVYEVSVCDYTNDRAYRMINPNYVKKHRKEAKSKSELANQAWDDVEYTDLEVDDDFIQKCLAIRAGEDYSTDVSVPLDLPDNLLLEAALNAHRQNITLNEYINNALREIINEYQRDPEGAKARADQWKADNNIGC